jgi:hypothetical protein
MASIYEQILNSKMTNKSEQNDYFFCCCPGSKLIQDNYPYANSFNPDYYFSINMQ